MFIRKSYLLILLIRLKKAKDWLYQNWFHIGTFLCLNDHIISKLRNALPVNKRDESVVIWNHIKKELSI